MKFLLLVLIGVILVPSVLSQNPTLDSYLKARSILDKAVAAYGGLEGLRSIDNVTFRIEGETVHRNQSRRTFMSERTPYKGSFIIDVKNTRYRQQQDGWYPGGFHWVNGLAINRNEGAFWDVVRGNLSPIPNVPASNFRARLRTFPHFLVLNAAERSSRLRFLGTTTIDRRPHSVISYANEDGLEISLFIDDKSGLLSKYDVLGTDPYFGDIELETLFTDYKEQSGRMVPTGRIDRRGREVTNDFRILDVTFNAALTDQSFKPPEGLKTPAPNPPPQSVTKYADNVFTVNASGYNVLAVGFTDYVFVMETPNGDAVSRQAITEIKKLFPGKPIRYVSVTHHHDDHAGGIRTYIAEGATILGLPGERSFFEKVAKSQFTIDPDALTTNPRPLKWESIEGGRRVLSDGTTTVELIDIGSGPHTEAMLVAYLPKEKLIFQGDLLNRPANNDAPTINDTTVYFAKWLESKKLDVERVIGVHGPPSTIEELRRGVAEHKSSQE